MKTVLSAALPAVALLPVLAVAQSPEGTEGIDEVVVVGKTVSTSLAQVDVKRDILVDTATVLKEIPGANVNANGPITGIAQYRGMYGDRVSVAIDHMGVVSGGPNAMDAPLSYVSPMITDSLSVERGIASVSAAAESIGGYVSTEIARGEFRSQGSGVSGFAGTRYSSNGNISTTAGRLSFATDRHRVSVVAEVDEGDDIDAPVGSMRPSGLNRDRSDLSYAFAGDDLDLMFYVGRLDTTDTGTPALPMDIRYIDTDLAGASTTYAVSESLSVNARLAWNDVTHLMDNFALRESPPPARQRQNLTTGTGTQFRLAGTWSLPGSELELGLSGTGAEHASTITNPNNPMFRVDNFVDVDRDVDSFFVEWRRRGAETGLEIGLRAKRVSTDAGIVGASGMMGMTAGLAQQLADDFNASNRDLSFTSVDAVLKILRHVDADTEVRVELGSKTRAPSYQELYLWLPLQATGGLADGRNYIGNLALDEERSNEITVGIGKRLGLLTLAPQAFYRRVNDYIQGVPSNNAVANQLTQMMSGQDSLEFANVDAEIWGADLAWRFELSEHAFLDGIATYARGRRTDASDNLYRLAPPNASIGFTWKPRNWLLNTKAVFHAAQDDVSAFNGEQSSAGYTLVHISSSWEPSEYLRLEARVDNLLDKTYQDHVAGINRAGGSDIPVGVRLYGPERTVSAGLIVSF